MSFEQGLTFSVPLLLESQVATQGQNEAWWQVDCAKMRGWIHYMDPDNDLDRP